MSIEGEKVGIDRVFNVGVRASIHIELAIKVNHLGSHSRSWHVSVQVDEDSGGLRPDRSGQVEEHDLVDDSELFIRQILGETAEYSQSMLIEVHGGRHVC